MSKKKKKLYSEAVSIGMLLANAGKAFAEAVQDAGLHPDIFMRWLTEYSGEGSFKEALTDFLKNLPFVEMDPSVRFTGVVPKYQETLYILLERCHVDFDGITQWLTLDGDSKPVEVRLFRINWSVSREEYICILRDIGYEPGTLHELAALLLDEPPLQPRVISALGKMESNKFPGLYGGGAKPYIELFGAGSPIGSDCYVIGYREL